ncbi:DNRLRE domain-containing protein [Streptomyces venezuelae]|uniref:DNRLRE domain-containing protein n=1 Tax=Streptomyces venezuelae TaxID=54571 RepID=UPI00278C7225|nr:DNRLRE domain-containing protein [Streptomyces venezuelae]
MLRTRTYSDTIRAKVGGEWKKIDTTLRRVKDGYSPSAVNDPLVFSAGSGSRSGTGARASRSLHRTVLPRAATGTASDPTWNELVRLTVDGHDIVVSWPGPLPAPVVDGPRALYENVRPGIDLLLTARDSGYSHVLIVHSREAAADPLLKDLDYRLSSPTLTFRLSEGSHVVTAVNDAGEEMAVAPTPYLWDSAGTVRRTEGEPTPTPAPAIADTALALPGLAGPQPGSHDSTLGATLAADGVLQLAVNSKALTDPDTVYPVFIDPSFKSRKTGWTLLYAKAPTSSFYNGQNFNDGSNEARVGYESTTQGLSRSVFNFEHSSKLDGAVIKSSHFNALQTYSWGCSSRQYNIYLAGAISGSTTWANQNNPNIWGRFIGSQVNGWGYQSGTCPDKWVGTDIKSVTQEASTKKWRLIGIGLRAADEGESSYWKKFMANGENSPYIETRYNHAPNEPYQMGMSTVPGGMCDTSLPYVAIGKSDITFRVSGIDPDGDLTKIHLKVWRNDAPGTPLYDKDVLPLSGSISVPLAWERFISGKSYSWTAWTIDSEGGVSAQGPAGTSAFCQFTVDQTAPSSPKVSSPQFPPPGNQYDTWSTVDFGTAGEFTFSTEAVSGTSTVRDESVVRYEYAFNTPNYTTNPALLTTKGAPVKKTLAPPAAGVNVLFAWAVDGAGNRSPAPAKYIFYVKPRKVPDPVGDLTGDGTPDLLAIDSNGTLRNYAAAPRGDVSVHMPAAYDAKGVLDDGYWSGTGGPAVISHHGDWFPGDGINDVMARMPDGKLYVYPGDGYGSFNTEQRMEVLLPPNAPATSTITQLVATGDITGDRLPDAMVMAGDRLWAFTGYTGASFTSATLFGGGWGTSDLVTVADISGDGIADLLRRTEDPTRGLLLRQGKASPSGGVDLTSLASEAASGAGQDIVYGQGGWTRASIPQIQGAPDASGDGIPDLWAVMADGTLRFYLGGRTTHGSATVVGEGGWTTLLTLG